MSKAVLKSYKMPPSLVELMDTAPINRSRLIRDAVKAAGKDNGVILEALNRRLGSNVQPPKADVVRVGFSLDDSTDETLEALETQSQLPKEHVLRLAIEAYIQRLNAKSSKKLR